MQFRQRALAGIHRAVKGVSRRTIFSRSPVARKLGFDVLGAGQELVVCASHAKEAFVVSSQDQMIGRELFISGEFDFNKFETAHALLVRERPEQTPKVLIDVGANIGTICIPAVARGLVERAISIEPDPSNCRLLRANIALNGKEASIRVEEAAAGASDGEVLQLTLSEHNFGDHRIVAPTEQHADAGRRSASVRSGRLDTLCADVLDEKLLIWIDVQGYEAFALQGATKFLERRVPLVIEFWPQGMAANGSFPILRSALAGYEGFWDLSNPRAFRPIGDLDAMRSELGGEAFTDLLVV